MADFVTRIVPADPWLVPPQDRLTSVRDYLRTLHTDVDEPSTYDMPGVIGWSSLWMTLICPNCRSVHEERGEVPWLGEAVPDIYDRQAGKPTNFDVTAPCCGATVSLAAFDSPYKGAERDRGWLGYQVLAFASASVGMRNFDAPLDAGQRAKLAQLMDCPIRFVVCRY
jgi:hypothetical protein